MYNVAYNVITGGLTDKKSVKKGLFWWFFIRNDQKMLC